MLNGTTERLFVGCNSPLIFTQPRGKRHQEAMRHPIQILARVRAISRVIYKMRLQPTLPKMEEEEAAFLRGRPSAE